MKTFKALLFACLAVFSAHTVLANNSITDDISDLLIFDPPNTSDKSSLILQFDCASDEVATVYLKNSVGKLFYAEKVKGKTKYAKRFLLDVLSDDIYYFEIEQNKTSKIIKKFFIESGEVVPFENAEKLGKEELDYSCFLLGMNKKLELIYTNKQDDDVKVKLVDLKNKVYYQENIKMGEMYAKELLLDELRNGNYQFIIDGKKDIVLKSFEVQNGVITEY